MFNFLWSPPKKQPCAPCVHPRWEIVKEVAFPSIAEQMQLETLPPSERAAILSKLQPSDFNKISFKRNARKTKQGTKP